MLVALSRSAVNFWKLYPDGPKVTRRNDSDSFNNIPAFKNLSCNGFGDISLDRFVWIAFKIWP